MLLTRRTQSFRLAILAFLAIAISSFLSEANAQPGKGRGQGFRGGQGRGQGLQGKGPGAEQHDDRHAADRDVFQYLLTNHAKRVRSA